MKEIIVGCALSCLWVIAWSYHLKKQIILSKFTAASILAAVILGVLAIVLEIWLEGFCFLCVLSAKHTLDRLKIRKFKIKETALKWFLSAVIGIVFYLTIGHCGLLLLA